MEELLDILRSLASLMEEESDQLSMRGPHPGLAEISAAKQRLVAALETRSVALGREQPNWLEQLEPEQRTTLKDALEALRLASDRNSDILKRQIELSAEMMAAVAAEAQRLTGTSNRTYGAHGSLFQIDQATPISLNAKF